MPRKGKPQESSPYDAIRGRWEAASVAQFLKLFKCKFNFACSSTQDLEEALVDAGSNLLADTFARLLRFLTGSTDILISNFEQHLHAVATEPRSAADPKGAEPAEQPKQPWAAFSSPEEKVVALKWLADLCLERRGEELHDFLEEYWRPDDMRGLCAGQDAFNNVYWYLDDLRLYRENNVKKASRKSWECVCVTVEDWIGFLKQFRKTNNPQERELYKYLNLELFPLIETQLRCTGSRRGKLPGNDKLVQEEARDVAAMLKEGQQDKAKATSDTAAVDSSSTLPKEEAAVVNGEDRPPTSEASGTSSTPGSDTLANGAGPASAPPASDAACQPSESAQHEGKAANESSGQGPETTLVGATTIKAEENSNSNHEFNADSGVGPGNVAGLGGIVGMGTPGGPPPTGASDGGQPLPSNVLPKQPPAEAQYMQQQSQIFVFSTTLANKAAESVLQGQFPSIIACHCAQPGTKKYLEKHPLKMAQFNRQQQNPAQWLNSFAQLKQQKSASASPVPPSVPTPNTTAVPPTSGGSVKGMPPGAANMMTDLGMAGWNQQGSNPMIPPTTPTMGQVNSPLKSCESPMMASAPMTQGSPSSQTTPMHHSPMMGPGVGSPNPMQPQSMLGPQPSLTGVKVPDENLTPQQRQHREEQLATLRKMQQMLFPEQQPGVGPPNAPPSGPLPPGVPNPDLAMQMGNYPGLMPPHKNNLGNMMPQQPTPTSVAAQMEWQKLQHQFYEEKVKKKGGGRGRGQQQNQPSQHPGGQPQQQGPPPPYHQGTARSASVPAALASPGTPSSPGNAPASLGASTLSLPSPRAASGLNSPGGFSSQQPRGLAGPSPTAPGVDSPNSARGTLNISNPGTPITTPGPGPSPGHKEEFSPVSQQTSVDGMFGRTLQSFAQQKQQQVSQPPKEPNLMPVPSPQQIQYLNTFEGQELTIQKQPNTSLRESDIMSPTLPTSAGPLDSSGPDPRLSGPNTPMTPSYAGPHTPHTPGGGDVGRFGVLPASPHTPSAPATHQATDKSKSDTGRFPPGSPTAAGPRFPGSVPPSTPLAPSPGPPNSNFPKHHNFPSEVQSPTKLSPGSTPSFTPDNIPLNPNSGNANAGNTNVKPSSHFDPITSMAQMSQQLTNSNSPGQNNAGMMGMNTPGVGGTMPVMGPFGSPMHPHHHHHHHHHPMEGMMNMGPGVPPPGMQQHMQQNMQAGMPPGMQPGMPMGMQQGMQQGGPANFSGGPTHMQGGPGGGPIMCSAPGQGGTSPMMAGPIQQSPSPKPCGPPGMMMMQSQPPRGSPPVPPGYPGMPMAPQQRMMLNRPPYNGANVQVKASAPNTIQYLPARPQSNNQGPRGPPSLDFLQRFANPLSNLDTKVPTHNLQYFPNSNGQSGGNSNINMGGPNVSMSMGGPNGQQMVPVGGNMNNPMGGPIGGGPGNPVGPMGSNPMMVPGGSPMGGNMNGPMGGVPPPNGPILGPNGPMGGMNGPMNMVGLRPQRAAGPGPMMRGGPPMFPQQPPGPQGPSPQGVLGPEQIFAPPQGPNANVTMFVPGAKASPMGHAPDASQPLPPSMGQASNFKNSPFIGPTTADPNYAQQFHNFQQQLYATNTRSQMNNQAISQNPSFFGPK